MATITTAISAEGRVNMTIFKFKKRVEIEKSIGNLKALLDEGVKAGVEEKIKSGNYTPPLNCGEGGDTGMSDADLLKIMG